MRKFLQILFVGIFLMSSVGIAGTGGTKFSRIKGWQEKTRRLPKPAGFKIDRSELIKMSQQIGGLVGNHFNSIQATPPRGAGIKNVIESKNGKPVIANWKGLDRIRAMRNWKISWSEMNGTPTFITGPQLEKGLQIARVVSPARKAILFVEAYRRLFKLNNPSRELLLESETSDEMGNTHVRFFQQYQGIPVWAHDVVFHFNKSGELYAFNGRYSPTPVSIDPNRVSISAGEAIQKVLRQVEAKENNTDFPLELQKLLGYSGPTARLYIWMDEAGEAHLVWHVEVRPNLIDDWYYFVDAGSGQILEAYNNTKFDGPVTAQATDLNGVTQTIHVYQIGSTYYMIDASRPIFDAANSNLPDDPRGALWTIDSNNKDLGGDLFHVTSSDNSWSDAVAVSAHFNMGQVFEYYFNTHNRQAIDGQGSTVISVIHVTNNGQPMDNAFWNGKMMAYGDGNQAFKPLAGALDVAAHEMTHGVTEKTVNLEYKFQSGALNESMSDVFGVMVDRDDWLLGEDVVLPQAFPTGALRSMSDPHNGGSSLNDPGWQPAHMNEFVNLTIDQDNGGVHINSGIPNKACYLIGNAIGKDKTEKIYYRILDAKYLNSQSNFADMRNAAIQSAKDLYGDNSPELTAVINAFDAVGITGGGGSQPDPDIPPVQGDQWIAAIGIPDQALYLVKPVIQSQNDIVMLTSTPLITDTGNPISVTDDGSVIFFVNASNFIQVIGSDGSGEQTISSQGIWKSIAISPDGTKLAATTIFEDSTLYVFDLVNSQNSKAYHLYNPTTQTDVKDFTTRYADAMDWDLSGQYLVFDSFNSVPQQGGGSVDFWTINVLDVVNDVILPIFPPLPEGISIGNPSFSQTNNDFMVFDLVDLTQGVDEIYGLNLFSGDLGMIVNNGSSIGYPKYSTEDNILIFERMVQSSPHLFQIPLASNRIQAAGSEIDFVADGIRPYWFAIGTRPTSIEEKRAEIAGQFQLYQNYPNPFNPSTTIRYRLPVSAKVKLMVYDINGKKIKTLLVGEEPAGEHRINWDGTNDQGQPIASGIYIYRLEAKSPNGSRMFLSRKMILLR